MKTILLILGPNAVGKSTTAAAILQCRMHTAYVDGDALRAINPFPFTEATRKAVTANIYCVIRNYLECDDIDMVVFPYSFHGDRRQMWEAVLAQLQAAGLEFVVKEVVLTCSETENRRRAAKDQRDPERIERGMVNTYHYYDDYPAVHIDTTGMTPEQVAEYITFELKLCLSKQQ